jgi:membrane protein
MGSFAPVLGLLKDAGLEFWKDKAPRLGAAIAFYTALSLSPMLVVVIAIAGFAFGEEAARGEIAHQIRGLVGDEGASAVEAMLANRTRDDGVVATVVGLAMLLVGATGLFAQLQDALDTIWGVEPKPAESVSTVREVGAVVWDRVLSFSLVCGIAFLLLVSLVFSAVLAALTGWMNGWLPESVTLVAVLNQAISFALTAVLFGLIFKLLPHVWLAWSDVWVGAVVTAGLFALGKFLIGLYLGRAAVGSAYGAAGSFVVLLVWVYYSTQILLLGAEITYLYATRYGSGAKAAAGYGVAPANDGHVPGAEKSVAPAEPQPAAP